VVVEVEHGDPAVAEPRHELGLGAGDVVDPAEVAEVGAADGEHDRDVGRGDAREVGEVADPVGAHLEDEGRGLLAGAQDRQRQADLVVEGPGRGDQLPARGQDVDEQVLGRRLADRAGDRDDVRAPAAP
jgi:hypothetical protein